MLTKEDDDKRLTAVSWESFCHVWQQNQQLTRTLVEVLYGNSKWEVVCG